MTPLHKHIEEYLSQVVISGWKNDARVQRDFESVLDYAEHMQTVFDRKILIHQEGKPSVN